MSKWNDHTLGAYVDGELSPLDAHAVDAALNFDPGLRARVAAIREASLATRAAFAAIERERVPARLIKTVRRYRPRPDVGPYAWLLARGRSTAVAFALVAALAVTAVGVGGYASGLIALRDEPDVARDDGWLDQVKRSYDLYAGIYRSESRALVDVDGAEGGAHVGAWFGQQLNRQLDVPDLSSHGLTLKGGRLVIVEGKPAAQFLYVTENGSPMALSVVPSSGKDQVIEAQRHDAVHLLHWRAGKYAYALIGGLELDALRSLADEIAPRLTPDA